jgi:hypothetical protein
VAAEVSTVPILIALAIGLVGFAAFLPLVVRDSRRPLPPPRPVRLRVREPRPAWRFRHHTPAPAPPVPAPVHVRPEVARRLAVVATAVVVLSLWSGWVGHSHSARR